MKSFINCKNSADPTSFQKVGFSHNISCCPLSIDPCGDKTHANNIATDQSRHSDHCLSILFVRIVYRNDPNLPDR